jgi:alkylation response protein AidB-like acyl-CoA dehydrogenase
MFLDLDDDQIALRDGIRSLLEGRFTSERIRAGFDRAAFEELADAGVFSLIADGFSWSDATVVFEQLGEFCVPGPLVGSFLASSFLASSFLASRRGDGTITGVVAAPPRGDGTEAATVIVEHFDMLDQLIVIDDDRVERVERADFAGIDADELEWPLDPLTPVTRLRSMPLRTAIEGAVAASWRDGGAVLTAAFCLGMSQRLTEMSVAYAKERQQFDRPIGGFQAVKHILADMAVRTEVARAAVYNASAHLDVDDPSPSADGQGLARAVSVAKALAGEAAIRNGKDATQVHGGMGYTWEVDVHLYLKRAWVLDTHFGSHEIHFDRIAGIVGP